LRISFLFSVDARESAAASAERLVLLADGDFDFRVAECGAAQLELRP
jgi:hypothetical protein